jgi:hypothetical protein
MNEMQKEILSSDKVSPYRRFYNDWIKENCVKRKVLDIGKSRFWEYGFDTIDINARINPTFVGDAQNLPFEDNSYDVVMCNGMYEFVENSQKMIDEAWRVAKDRVIYGFVGKDYKPYKKDWKFFEGKEIFHGKCVRIDYGNEYHFFVCIKNSQ